jgi:cephalosporin hydroxylase
VTEHPSKVVAEFHTLYNNSSPQARKSTAWLGTQVLKCPLDIWIYQEILHGGTARFIPPAHSSYPISAAALL